MLIATLGMAFGATIADTQELTAIDTGNSSDKCQKGSCNFYKISPAQLAAFPYPSRFCPDPGLGPANFVMAMNIPPDLGPDNEYGHAGHLFAQKPGHDLLMQLSRIEDINFKTLWETDSSELYLAVDHEGIAGFKIGPKTTYANNPVGDYGEADSVTTRETGLDEPPLVHGQSLTYQKSDLSLAVTSGDDM